MAARIRLYSGSSQQPTLLRLEVTPSTGHGFKLLVPDWRITCLCLREPVALCLFTHPEGVYICCYRYKHQTLPASDQSALCLNSWPAAQRSAHLNSTTDYSTSASAHGSATRYDDIDALHCNAYHIVLQHHVFGSLAVSAPDSQTLLSAQNQQLSDRRAVHDLC